MFVYEVCVFDEGLNINKNITIVPKAQKVLKQLLGYLKEKISYEQLSEETKDLVYIIEDEITYLFVCSLLYINTKKEIIADYSGIPVDSVELFEEIAFRTNKFRGKIKKIGFFKKLIVSDNKQYQNLGIILKAAYNFGEDYIKWKFGLNESSTEITNIVNNTFKDIYFKYLENSYKTDDNKVMEHIKAGKQIISAAVDIQKAASMSGGSSTDDIKNYLMKLQEETQNSQWEEEIEVVDIFEHNNIKDNNG